MVVLSLLWFFLLLQPASTLNCYHKSAYVPLYKAELKPCEKKDQICQIEYDPSDDDYRMGCTRFYHCGETGAYCCKEDGCNRDFPKLQPNESLQCATALVSYYKSDNMSVVTSDNLRGSCSENCKRKSKSYVSDGSLAVNSYFGCSYQKFLPCLLMNACYIDLKGYEQCCCDTNNCNAYLPPTSLLSVTKNSINCYTGLSAEEITLCPDNQVCRKTENDIGCASPEKCKVGECCGSELCNDHLFTSKEAITCKQGIFMSNGTALIPHFSIECVVGCGRYILNDTVTFRCATFECIGKADGCEGSRCCCFAADCADTDLYPLPSEFKALIPILTRVERNYPKVPVAEDEENAVEGGDYEQVEDVDDGSWSTKISLLILLIHSLL